jgi:hypothetical protein
LNVSLLLITLFKSLHMLPPKALASGPNKLPTSNPTALEAKENAESIAPLVSELQLWAMAAVTAPPLAFESDALSPGCFSRTFFK